MTGHIADDLSNTSPGYSFVSDYWNYKFHNGKLFLTLIMNTSILWDEFVIAIAVNETPLLNLE